MDIDVLMFLAKAFQTDPRPTQEAKALSDADYHVFVLAWDREREFSSKETVDRTEVKSLSHLRLQRFLSVSLALGALIFQAQLIIESVRLIGKRKKRPIVHAHDFNTLIPGCILRILRLARALVYDAHELTYAAYEELYTHQIGCIARTLEQLCLPYAEAVVTVSQPFAEYFRRFNDAVKIIENCPVLTDLPTLSKSRVREQLGLPLNQFIVSYIGTIRYDCNLDLLLDVASLQADQEVYFLVVGDGPEAPEFRQNASRSKASLTVLHRVPRRTALAYVTASDLTWGIYRVDSLNMKLTLPWKFFESLTCQVPLLVEEGFLTAELTKRFGCGIIIANENPYEILKAIKSLARDHSAQRRMRAAARKAAENYTWEGVSQKLVSLYGKLETDLAKSR
jgi:glycosyltransferase involved in cell wall biosynthesis